MPAHTRPARRTRSRRTLTAALLALPLVAVPVAAPAVAVASTVDARGYGGWYGGGGLGFGGYGAGPGLSGGYDAAPETAQSAAQQAGAATAAQSAGVVLIDTVLDYGQGEAAGTGLVLSADGTVVTNHHVVAGATSITVTVPKTGRKYRASVVGYSTSRDVAVLRLSGASGLTPVRTDPTVAVGEAVTAVGNAEGAGSLTAAAGTVLVRRTTIDVSGDDGTTEHLRGLIENSSDVVSGDSGGALLDAQDEVVGMNVAASAGSGEVTGYAIPIARVLRIGEKIGAGTATSTITIGARAALGVQVVADAAQPEVAGVVAGGPAEDAGIAAGDTITSVGTTSVSTYTELTRALATHHAGDRVRVGWQDAVGAAHTATVTLGTAPVG